MGLFQKIFENRATGSVEIEDSLLKALMGRTSIDRETALQVPTVSGAVDLIANTIASTPIKLYKEEDGKTHEVKDDYRLDLLNDDTGDTLNANEFWKAITRDYFLGKGGYAYIHKEKGKIKSLHYVDERNVAIQKNTDPIFKDFVILVNGTAYKPFQFLKILRNTKDGMTGNPVTVENSTLIETSYESLIFEMNSVKRGGNKKGFLKSEKRVDENVLKNLKAAFNRLYSNKSDNMIVLNNGIDFKECSNTSTEMQMNENKKTNAEEFAKIFHISTDIISGKSGGNEASVIARLAAIPLMTTIQCALNRDLLLEKEKKNFYFAFDTKELLKGNMKERFDAYKVALDSNFMQIDEVRYAEDLEPLGLSWIKLGLKDVLYDPDTKTVYTPNTNTTSKIGEQTLIPDDEEGIIDREERANPHRDKKGRFASGRGSRSTKSGNKKETTSLKGLVGKKTSDDRTVESIHPHAQRRARERNIYASSVARALMAKPTKGNEPGSLIYQAGNTRVIYITKENQIRSVIYRKR